MNLRPVACLSAILALLTIATTATAAGVLDDPKFFSPTAKAKAEEIINGIQKKHKFDVLVEVIATPPAGDVDRVAKMTESDKDKFFDDLAIERAKVHRLKGALLLVCVKPGHLSEAVGRSMRDYGYSKDDSRETRRVMLAAFKAKDHDQGLLDGLNHIRNSLALDIHKSSSPNVTSPMPGTPPDVGHGNHDTARAQPKEVPHGGGISSWLLILGAVCIVFILLGMFRRSSGNGGYNSSTAMGPGYGGFGGGGGFMGGFLSSLAGVFAGNWLFNRFNDRGQAYGNEPHSGHYGGDSGHGSDRGEDYDAGGGSFDDDSSSGSTESDSGGGFDSGSSFDSGGGFDSGGSFDSGGGGDSGSF